jgi:uncharacterized membrane protein YedE/YeeE
MVIAWGSFTPGSALVGGVLIGLAAAVYVLGNGRIAGITGIAAGPWRSLLAGGMLRGESLHLMFLAGLLAAPFVWRLLAPLPKATLTAGVPVLVLAGLLVGVGTRMANGCTSGHGVCGLARLSLRSLVNVLVFMAAAFATVFVLRHLS